jgi:cysteine desulfurase/selenocysteine lyase
VQNIFTQLDSHTRVLALSAVSNVLGLINPVEEIITTIRKQYPNLLILVDACQAIGHIPVSVKKWDVDYLVFSGHKVFGPTGIGVLSGKKRSLERLGAINVGGGTVLDPLSSPVLYKKLPDALEGGTPNIAGIVGLAAAIKYVEELGIAAIHAHEKMLLLLLERRLRETFGESVHILGGTEQNRGGILSFTLDDIHPHDLAHLLGEENICIRAGEHCARPLHHILSLPASARVSVSIYNTEADIETLMAGIQKALRIFAV